MPARIGGEPGRVRTLFETISRLSGDETAWFGDVASALAEALPASTGCAINFAEWSDDGALASARTRAAGLDRYMHEGPLMLLQSPAALHSRAWFPPTPVMTLSPIIESFPAERWRFKLLEVSEAIGVLVRPLPALSAVLCFRLERPHELTCDETRLLTRLQLFFEAALDARTWQRPAAVYSADAEFLEGDGNPDGLWPALAAGRYRLHPAHRSLMLLENRAGDAPRRRLSPHERSALELVTGTSAKHAAIELQVSPATLSRLLATGAEKLGFPDVARATRFLRGLLKQQREYAVEHLTPAEREVLALVRQCLSNEAIAERRSTSKHTIAKQVTSLLRKTGALNRRLL